MKITVLDIKGNKTEELNVNESVFGVKPNLDLLAQYVRVFLSNQRQGTSSTKTRAEVSGGGKKPWNQKHTGRARQGSNRSPIWRHGGVAHGPKPKDWGLALPKKLVKGAVISALSQKFSENPLVVESLDIKDVKTKSVSEILKNLKATGSILFVTNKANSDMVKAARNIEGVIVSNSMNLNAYELLNARTLIISKDAVLNLQEKYGSKN